MACRGCGHSHSASRCIDPPEAAGETIDIAISDDGNTKVTTQLSMPTFNSSSTPSITRGNKLEADAADLLKRKAAADLALKLTAANTNSNEPTRIPLSPIVSDDQFIYIVEQSELHVLMIMLRLELKNSDISHYIKIHVAIIQSWQDWFVELKADLNHFITFEEPHWNTSGSCYGASLDHTQITQKVEHITLNNASNNNTMMIELAILLRTPRVTFDANDNRHSQTPVDDDVDVHPPADRESHIFAQTVAHDLTILEHSIVHGVHSSGQRKEHFNDIVKEGNVEQYFFLGDPPIVIKLSNQ
ncbi:hypothetical protein A0H81_10827 [Grifola frondosa]|uniref:Uncharacterized protein n=1 Tax=Grifola frondosa TaxID=5627 RepID=A0A1C7LX08_GRIFR|nr:hypothetical protein A0H81_10827 [Grifola frondosa]